MPPSEPVKLVYVQREYQILAAPITQLRGDPREVRVLWLSWTGRSQLRAWAVPHTSRSAVFRPNGGRLRSGLVLNLTERDGYLPRGRRASRT
jgi:hypothetical protein